MKTKGIAGFVVIFWIVLSGAILVSAGKEVSAYHKVALPEVTWYDQGWVTKSGEYFNPEGMTCAVRDPKLIGHWLSFEYDGASIDVYANDLMPPNSKAEYDLTPRAFSQLASLKKGRIHAIVKVINEP